MLQRSLRSGSQTRGLGSGKTPLGTQLASLYFSSIKP